MNATGHEQALALAASLRTAEVTAVFSSPLVRAVQTAAPVAENHGLTIQTDDALLEMDVGALDGLSGREMRERFPDVLRAWTDGEAGTLRLPHGESLLDVEERAWRFLEGLEEAYGDVSALCVTHNFVCLAVLCHALGLPVGQFRRLRQSICGLSILDLRPGRSQILKLNDTCHLVGHRA